LVHQAVLGNVAFFSPFWVGILENFDNLVLPHCCDF
jgi:hypothetical protein